jgi:hypothetical protein
MTSKSKPKISKQGKKDPCLSKKEAAKTNDYIAYYDQWKIMISSIGDGDVDASLASLDIALSLEDPDCKELIAYMRKEFGN